MLVVKEAEKERKRGEKPGINWAKIWYTN